MSKEYIEREKALEKVIEVKHYDPELSGVVLHRYIKEIDLKDIPAADVVEVRHGRWVNTHSDSEFAQCSLCKYPVYAAWIWNLTNYCPNCGAKLVL